MDYQSRLIFVGKTLQIGEWRCYPDSSLWGEENIAGHLPMLVFPRTSVQIQQASRELTVTTTNQIMYYNKDQTYYRGLVSRRGDICEYYYVCPQVLAEMFASLGVPEPSDLEAPFHMSHGPCDSHSFLVQRALYRYLSTTTNPDPILVEESFLSILPRLLRQAVLLEPGRQRLRSSTIRHRRFQVEVAKEFLTKNWHRSIALDDIAKECECSVFHLCRIFKECTGLSIVQFLSKLRLHNALEPVIDTDTDLIHIAIRSGFCSHSHLTRRFGRAFGLPPSEVRQLSAARLLEKLQRPENY